MRTLKYLSIFVIGGMGYALVELLWRGRTHWTMILAGGGCFTVIYLIDKIHRMPMAYKCALGAAAITVIEFLVGCLVNRMLGWHVWDYSRLEFNIMGQVCLLFSVIWYLMCVPALYLGRMLDRTLFVYYEKIFENGWNKRK